MWGILNGGDASEILADTSLTQRAKRAILAQKDLVSKAALERLIRNAVGSAAFEEYYSDPGPESGDSEMNRTVEMREIQNMKNYLWRGRREGGRP